MKALFATILLSFPLFSWGQSFSEIVDFDFVLSSLEDPALVEEAVQSQRLVILEGVVGDSYIEETAAGINVWVTLLGGAWIGTREVRSYACQILFRGESWLDVFPSTRPGKPTADYIPPGRQLLIVCRLIGGTDGTPRAEMVDYRILD